MVVLSLGRRVPLVLQSEVAECGLACMTMLARYHGHDLDLASLRRRHGSSLQGSNLAGLMRIADRLGLAGRPLRIEMEYLPQLRLPCVLHWNLNHFVVLTRVSRRGLHLNDPAAGERVVSLAEASGSFTGIALELTRASGFAPQSERRRYRLRDLTGPLQGVRGALAQLFGLALLLEALTLCLPLAMQWVLDSVLVAADVGLLSLLGCGFLFVVAFQACVLALRGWLVAGLGASLVAQWVTHLYAHLLRLPLAYFERRSVGEVMSRFNSVDAIRETLSGSVVGALLDGLTLLLLLLVLAAYSPLLTAVVLVGTGAYALLRWASYGSLYRLREQCLSHWAKRHSRILESIQGALSLKLANRNEERRARLANVALETANRELAADRTEATYAALSRLLAGIQRVAVIWLGALLALDQRFSVGMLVVFVAYSELFANRAAAFIDHFAALRMLRMHVDRIADIALEEPEADLHSDYLGAPPRPTIELRDVGFRYAEDQPWILRHCNVRIESGESVVIAGPSGCGKTTLAKIVLGLLQPSEGSVLIGGIDIRRYGLAAYRELFGCVMQDDQLLAGSLAENIAFFDPAADLERIRAAAEMAAVDGDILAMTMGYETLVGDMGSALSGGQKQRVMLARALYRQPSLLLLDEATSHLDVEREREINARVAALRLTRILIAHRPETIASAERLLRLEHGVLVDSAREERPRPALAA